MKGLCIYCGEMEGTTHDHIPPKCFFPKPCPNIQRITVPCCEACRLQHETNDAFVRNLLISTIEAEPHQAVQSQLGTRRNRSFRDRQQLKAVLNHMALADVHSKAGIYLGSAPAFNFDSPRMDSFFHRLARGLLHEETQTGFVQSRIEWRRNPPPDICEDFLRQGRFRVVGDIFSYCVLLVEGELTSLWLLTFYERLRFIVLLRPIVA
jgi:hypothetical protein